MRTSTLARWAAATVGSALLLVGVGTAVSQADEARTTARPRGAMLVLDTSGSMKGNIAAARTAALEYSRSVPADVRVGLVTFDDEAARVTKPTTNRAALAEGLGGLRHGGDTAMYDAIRLGVSALDELGPAAERRLVVLSDGIDTASQASLGAARKALVSANVVADFVAFRYGSENLSAIKALAKASGGRVLTAQDAAQLADAFAEIARSAPTAAATHDGGLFTWVSDATWQLWLIAGLTFAAVLLLVLALAFGAWRRDSGNRGLQQIAQYGPQPERARPEQAGSLARSAVGWTDNLLRSRGWDEKLGERLDLAGIAMKPAEWTIVRICAGVVLSALSILLGVNVLLGVLIGAVLGYASTWALVHVRISSRRRAFGEQLPDVLQLVAGSLRSGFSLVQALDSVVREGTQPAAEEFARALSETRIGVELEAALDRAALRMASDDLKWIVMAIRIQREVGGNLAEVLLTTVSTMRERAQTRRQVRALSAEGRISAYILLALPVGLGAFFFLTNPEYMRPLHTTNIGILMLIGSGVLMAVGSFWMSRLIKVEV